MTIARTLMIALAAFMSPHLVQAQNVFVTAGEHTEFTRVFLDAPPGTNWALDVNETSLEFSTTGAVTGFNLSRAYERITDRRISGFSPISATKLRIDLACNCVAEATDWGQGDVVIDIRDRNEEIAVMPETVTDDPLDSLTYDWTQNLTLQWRNMTAPRPPAAPEIPAEHMAPFLGTQPTEFPLLGGNRNAASNPTPIDALAKFSATTEGFPNTALAFPSLTQDSSGKGASSEFQNALLRQLQRAALQGVVSIPSPEIAVPLLNEVNAEPPRVATDAKTGEATHSAPAQPAAMQQMVVTTAQDAALPESAGLFFRTAQSQGCRPHEWFDPQFWSAPGTGPGLAGLRADLVGEFDKPNIGNVTKLARYYLNLGFGLEARKLVRTFEVPPETSATIEQISRILDGEDITDPSILTSQVGCNPAATLWALIADPAQVFNPDLEVAAVLAAFSTFPVQLRNLTGPLLAENFSKAGKRDAAIGIRNLVDRSIEADNESLSMINAEIDIADGDVEAASLALSSVISEDRTQAAEAMIKLITERKRAGLSVEAGVASAADALAVEYRGTMLGRQLTEAAIRAFSISGQPQITFDRIHDAQARKAIEASTIRNLINQAFLDAVRNTDDVAFLRLVHKEDLPEIKDVRSHQMRTDIDTRLAVANRLIGLGFYGKASQILAPLEPNSTGDVRAQFARIAYGTGQFDDAIALLTGRYDLPAQELRANAMFQIGEYATAATIYDQIGEKDGAVNAAWISGDFERAARMDTGQLSQLVTLSEIDTPRIDSLKNAQQPLETWRQATQQSRALRETIQQILD